MRTNKVVPNHKLMFMKKITLSSIIVRLLLFLFIWWVLTEGDDSSWWIGLPAVILSTIISIILFSPAGIVYMRLVAFIPLFLVYSFKGALDVALRVFHPRLPISPDMVEYPLDLPHGLSRVFMVNLVNLIPGTLTVQLEENVLTIHLMDIRDDFKTELIALEKQVASIFGLPQNFNKGVK